MPHKSNPILCTSQSENLKKKKKKHAYTIDNTTRKLRGNYISVSIARSPLRRRMPYVPHKNPYQRNPKDSVSMWVLQKKVVQKNHIRAHTKETPYTVWALPEVFSMEGLYLKDHIRTHSPHTKEKPYHCVFSHFVKVNSFVYTLQRKIWGKKFRTQYTKMSVVVVVGFFKKTSHTGLLAVEINKLSFSVSFEAPLHKIYASLIRYDATSHMPFKFEAFPSLLNYPRNFDLYI